MLSELSENQIEKNFLLLQLSSSGFPSGSYTHSSGFEALLEDGTIYDAQSLRCYLRIWLLESVARCDGPAVAQTHTYMQHGQTGPLLDLSELLSAMKYSNGSYNSSVMVGKATFNSVRDSSPDLSERMESFMAFDSEQKFEHHHAIVWGIITKLYGVNRTDAVSAYLFSTFSGVLEVVARLMPLGQRDTQEILATSYADLLDALDTSLQLEPGQLSSQSAIQDIAGMAHERLSMKMCIT